jgi:hypothetical protein
VRNSNKLQKKKLTQDLMVGYSVKMYAGKERDDDDDFRSRVRGRCHQGTRTKATPPPPLPSQQPSVCCRSNCASADEKQNTRKEGKLPMDKKNEVHIPDPKPGPEHEVHIYEVQSPDTRGRPHIESPT